MIKRYNRNNNHLLYVLPFHLVNNKNNNINNNNNNNNNKIKKKKDNIQLKELREHMIVDQENLNKDNKNKVVQRYQILKYLVNQLRATFMIHNYKRQLKDLRKEECNNNNKVNLLEQLNNLKINYKK